MEVKGRDLSSNSDRECNLRAIMNKNGNLKWVQAHKKKQKTSPVYIQKQTELSPTFTFSISGIMSDAMRAKITLNDDNLSRHRHNGVITHL